MVRLETAARLFFVAMALMLCSSTVCPAETYYVNGKEVDLSTYRAIKLINSATELIKKDKVQEAARQLQQAVKFAPTLSDGHSLFGLVLARLGRTDEA